jgi:nucleoside-diphosphate-sugar epimerase
MCHEEQEMNQTHVIVGAGPIGSGIARLLVSQGRSVRTITRSGSGPEIEGVERIAADASDARRVAELTADAAAIYNCANPQYHRWPTDWPPIAHSLLNAAERSGAVLVTIGNLYVYGPATESLGVPAYDRDHPMTEETPLATIGTKGRVRRQMWLDALALHEAGRIRTVEIRSSDYIGPDAQGVIGERVIHPLLRGKAVWIPGRTDRLHTFTFTGDVARLAAAVAAEPEAHGRVWHTPSNEARTARQTLDDLARLAGAPRPTIRTIPDSGLYVLGLVSPLMRELRETNYQRRYDFVMDSSAAERAFGLAPTSWDTVLRAVLAPSLNAGDARPAQLTLKGER